MCENKLETAVMNALEQGQRAQEALNRLQFEDRRQRRRAYALEKRLQSSEFFDQRSIDDLTDLLKPLQEQVEAGRRTEVIADEHVPEGYWLNHILLDEAAALQDTIHPLEALLKALKRVQVVCRAEAILGHLYDKARK